ncbi:hypothetical protein JCM19294_2288 [Nonlabens tegetincola]|uniref:Uncharacterized protein n=1 Tax=Nonlabens tegetincola TaxID=323273 RepID=A0A090QJ31_9FLAO|nr:hypothetical protein [Nonlabens tegetincola]GAK95506.1 hypothetical protein JCM19294_2288 [Nonlabens tegetincola]
MYKLDSKLIINHHQLIKSDPKNAYHSWRHCYDAFGNVNQDNTYLALHLGFYLASWGMYRGSAAISHKDYTIHIGAVDLIREHYFLRCHKNHEVEAKDQVALLDLCNALREHYSSFNYLIKGELVEKKPTDTLISKIIIGTVGCSPAFDRYFNKGVRESGFNFTRISKNSFDALFSFRIIYHSELLKIQKQLFQLDNYHYPIFKIIDKYFWHKGFHLENKN